MTTRQYDILRLLAKSEWPLTGNEIGYGIGLRTGSDRHAHDGRSMAVAQRVISSLTSLRSQGLVDFGRRRDGRSGTAYYITPAGRHYITPEASL